RRIPHHGRLIPTARDNALAIRGIGHGPNPTNMTSEISQLPPALDLPTPRRPIQAARDNPLAVRRKGRGKDSVCVSFKSEHLLIVGNLPSLNRPTPSAGMNLFTSIWRKNQRASPGDYPLDV